MRGSLAQASMEYVMIAGFVALVIIPTTFLFYSYASDSAEEIDRAQIDKFGNDVVSTAETVYYLGHPSRMTISERLPKNVQSISIDRDPSTGTYLFAIAATSKSGVINLTFPTKVRLLGEFSQNAISPGEKSVKIYAGPNLNNNPFVAINLENSSCESDTVMHLDCSPTQPLYCFNGVLLNNCNECGCSAGTCQPDGTCA